MIATLTLLTLTFPTATEPATGADKLVVFAERAYTAPGEVVSDAVITILAKKVS